MATKTIPAGEFKARCLALLDDVERTGVPLVVTKRGRPVAKVLPAGQSTTRPLKGSILEEHDLVAPTGEKWDAET